MGIWWFFTGCFKILVECTSSMMISLIACLSFQKKEEILCRTEVVNTHTGRAELWWCNLRATSRSSCFFFLFLTERSPPGRWLGLKGVSREGGEGKSHNWAPLDYFFAPLLRLQFPFFIFLEGSTSSYTYRHGTSAFHRIFRHTIKKPSHSNVGRRDFAKEQPILVFCECISWSDQCHYDNFNLESPSHLISGALKFKTQVRWITWTHQQEKQLFECQMQVTRNAQLFSRSF